MISIQIRNNCKAIAQVLEMKVDQSNPDEVIGKINDLTNILSLSATNMALAEQLYNNNLGEYAERYLKEKISATDKKQIFSKLLCDEIYLVTLAAEQNKAIKYSIEGLRSIISYLKEDFKQSQFTN